MDRLNRLSGRICIATEWFCAICLAAILVILFWEVVSRYVLGESAQWRNELPKFIFVGVSLLMATPAWRTDGHIKLGFIINHLPRQSRNILVVLFQIICLILVTMWLYFGLELEIFHLHSPLETEGMMLQWEYIFWIIPLSMLLLLFSGIVRLIDSVASLRKGTQQ